MILIKQIYLSELVLVAFSEYMRSGFLVFLVQYSQVVYIM